MTTLAHTQQVISHSAAQTAVCAAVSKAEDLGIRINAAVVDSGGNLSSFLRMPGAFLHSIDIAIDKALTAAGFGFATSQWDELLPQGSTLRAGVHTRPRLVTFGGGIPIEMDGMMLGGVGVSGGSEDQDVVCAEAALDAIRDLAK